MDPTLQAACVRNGGFFTVADAASAGISAAAIRAGCREGEWQRLRRGVLVEAGAFAELTRADQHLVHVRVALAHLRSPAYPSHRSAAVALGVALLDEPTAVELTGAGVDPRNRGDLRVVRAELPPGALAPSPAGLTTTSAARTVVDLARLLPVRAGVVSIDSALHQRLTTPAELRDMLDSQSRWPGLAAARAAVGLADGRSESPGETCLRLVAQQLGYAVTPQRVICGATGDGYRVDLRLDGEPVILEFDGRVKYQGPDAEQVRWAEKRRHDDLGNAGYQIVRVTWDLLFRPAVLRAAIESARTRARGRHVPGLV